MMGLQQKCVDFPFCTVKCLVYFLLCEVISLKNQGLISKIIFLRDTTTMGKGNKVTGDFMSLTVI